MRVRGRDVQQARERSRPVLVRVIVAVPVLMMVVVIMARAAYAVHDIQDARINTLPHIDKCRACVLANWTQRYSIKYQHPACPGAYRYVACLTGA
jgi:hypothetical protein